MYMYLHAYNPTNDVDGYVVTFEDGANYEDVSKPCNVEGHLFCEMNQEASVNEC